VGKFLRDAGKANMRKILRQFGGPVLDKMGMAGVPTLIEIDITGPLKMGIPGIGETPADSIYGGGSKRRLS
jgi:hypothetical protein